MIRLDSMNTHDRAPAPTIETEVKQLLEKYKPPTSLQEPLAADDDLRSAAQNNVVQTGTEPRIRRFCLPYSATPPELRIFHVSAQRFTPDGSIRDASYDLEPCVQDAHDPKHPITKLNYYVNNKGHLRLKRRVSFDQNRQPAITDVEYNDRDMPIISLQRRNQHLKAEVRNTFDERGRLLVQIRTEFDDQGQPAKQTTTELSYQDGNRSIVVTSKRSINIFGRETPEEGITVSEGSYNKQTGYTAGTMVPELFA